MIDWLKADTSYNVVICKAHLKVMESRLQVHFSVVLLSHSLTVVKFVFGCCSSKMLISSGQRRGQNFPEINTQQSGKQSAINLTVEIRQHLADWQRPEFQTHVWRSHVWHSGESSSRAQISEYFRHNWALPASTNTSAASDCLLVYLHTWVDVWKASEPPAFPADLCGFKLLTSQTCLPLLPPFFSSFYTSASIGSMFVFGTL